MKRGLLVIYSLSLCWAVVGQAFADQPAHFSIVEHKQCAEIRLTENEGSFWSAAFMGGNLTLQDTGFEALARNLLTEVQFGNDGQVIDIVLSGKSVVPQVMTVDHRFSTELHRLVDDHRKTIIGRALILTDLEQGPFQDTTAPYGTRDRILLGVLFFSNTPESVPLTVRCDYVRHLGNPEEIERSSQCVWIDSSSREQNGKPYCW